VRADPEMALCVLRELADHLRPESHNVVAIRRK
jgi:hypothetical protein